MRYTYLLQWKYVDDYDDQKNLILYIVIINSVKYKMNITIKINLLKKNIDKFMT